jgi:hypothetical protein
LADSDILRNLSPLPSAPLHTRSRTAPCVLSDTVRNTAFQTQGPCRAPNNYSGKDNRQSCSCSGVRTRSPKSGSCFFGGGAGSKHHDPGGDANPRSQIRGFSPQPHNNYIYYTTLSNVDSKGVPAARLPLLCECYTRGSGGSVDARQNWGVGSWEDSGRGLEAELRHPSVRPVCRIR